MAKGNGKPRTQKGQPACGLCGNTENLTKTECCDNWICDDQHEYVMFSFKRNSCSRNHEGNTICGLHYNEGHAGNWQDCDDCRKAFETELYVYYGTNEYNFEKLTNPPDYEPTLCATCGAVIVLGDGGYSLFQGNYTCGSCSVAEMGDLPGLSDVAGYLDEVTPDPANEFPATSGGPSNFTIEKPTKANLKLLRNEVPDDFKDRFDAIIQQADKFCEDLLNDEYKQLSREMAASVCQEGSPVLKGKVESWTAGIIYILGQVNFLTDPSQTPHLKSDEIAKGIGISTGTMQSKAKIIREGLQIVTMDPRWSLSTNLENNPLVWMFEMDGMILDLRNAPRDVQVLAYEQGLIPYIPDGHVSESE